MIVMRKRAKKWYTVRYTYNNGMQLESKVIATSAINALRKDGAWRFLHDALFQSGSSGQATASAEDGELDAVLYCGYSSNGKWHARYEEDVI